MAERISEMVKVFDGTSGDVATWLKKFKLVARLKRVETLSAFIPLYLEGNAFEVFDQLEEDDKEDASKIEEALLNAFAQSNFDAYDAFRQRSWRTGEAVDVYLADLRRLARLAEIENDILLLRAFVVGFPSDISNQLRAATDINVMSLEKVLQLARVYVANRNPPAAIIAEKKTYAAKCHSVACYRCGREGHIARFCSVNLKSSSRGHEPASSSGIKCYKCGKFGHISRYCTSNAGNASGKLPAPAVSLDM